MRAQSWNRRSRFSSGPGRAAAVPDPGACLGRMPDVHQRLLATFVVFIGSLFVVYSTRRGLLVAVVQTQLALSRNWKPKLNCARYIIEANGDRTMA